MRDEIEEILAENDRTRRVIAKVQAENVQLKEFIAVQNRTISSLTEMIAKLNYQLELLQNPPIYPLPS